MSNSSSFGQLLFSSTVTEQPGTATTSVSVTNNLPAGGYFWRVQASDAANGVTSPLSPTIGFTFQPFSLSQAAIYNSPLDLASWAETARITSIVFSGDGAYFNTDFDKRDGPDRWPDVPFGSGNLQYTLGMCVNINNHWYCSAVVQFWFNRELSASGRPSDVSFEWFYDPVRWGPMPSYQPRDGELVGVFACAGNCRNNDAGDRSYVKERTNLALVPWSNHGAASYSFGNKAIRH